MIYKERHSPFLLGFIATLLMFFIMSGLYVWSEQSNQRLQYINQKQRIENEALSYDVVVKEDMIAELQQPMQYEYPSKKYKFSGSYKITYYQPFVTGTNRTASGDTATSGVGKWCAANIADFAIGDEIYIDGIGELIIKDTGVPPGVIDVLVYDTDTAIKLGVKYNTKVWRVIK